MPTAIENCSIQRCPCNEEQGGIKDVRQVLSNHPVSLLALLPMIEGSERVRLLMAVLGRGQGMGCMLATMPKLFMHMALFETANIELTL
jgi:hypothetical protein